jgi:hypothetical protein
MFLFVLILIEKQTTLVIVFLKGIDRPFEGGGGSRVYSFDLNW